jgi:hypothetical protein
MELKNTRMSTETPGRLFDSTDRNRSKTKLLLLTFGVFAAYTGPLFTDSASNRNEYQESSLGKGRAGCT